MADPRPGGGLDEAAAANRERRTLGGETDLTAPDDPLAAEPLLGGGAGSLAGLDGGGIAVEAASLGSADGSLADRAAASEPGAERLGAGPTGAEAIGVGAGRGEVGSGTPSDTGDFGGGGAERGTKSAASPGGDGR